jgi:hypothetical protein
MKDSRIFAIKLRAEKDNLITAGACRLFLRIATWRYCIKDAPADATFALSWADVARWYGANEPESVRNKRTVYGWMRELIHNRYLHYNGLKGCPAKSCYRLEFYFPQPLTLLDWAANRAPQHTSLTVEHGELLEVQVGQKTTQLVGRKTTQLVGRKTTQQVVQKTAPPKYSYSLREEMYNTEGKKSQAGSAGTGNEGEGINSSLRSKKRLEGDELTKFMAGCKKEAGL